MFWLMVHGIHQLSWRKKAKRWRQSVLHSGKPLHEYILSCPFKQGAPKCVPIVGSVDAHVRSQGVSLSGQGRAVVVSVSNPPHS